MHARHDDGRHPLAATAVPGGVAAVLQCALGYHKAGDSPRAAQLCHQILSAQPEQPHALLLLGLILGKGADPERGAALIARYLRQNPTDAVASYNLGMLRQRAGDSVGALALFDQTLARDPDHAAALHGRGVSLHALGRDDEAVQAFERALALQPGDAVTHNNYGDVLHSRGAHAAALAAFDRATALDPRLAIAHCNRGVTLAALERHDAAIAAFRQAVALDPALVRAHFELATVLDAVWRPVEAHRHRVQAVRLNPLVSVACTAPPASARVLLLGSAGRGDLPTRCLIDPARFTRVHLLLLAPGEATDDQAAVLARVPPVDVVLITIADADRGAPYLPVAAAAADAQGRAVLNPPARIAPTRRDRIAGLLRGIPGVVTPRTRRLTRVRLAAIAATSRPLRTPMLVRPCGEHGGEGLERVDHAASLGDYLARMPFDAFYLSRFCDYVSGDGWYRKYRFIFVDRVAYPYHLAISAAWCVHYWRGASEPWIEAEEARFLDDPAGGFPGSLTAVAAIAQRVDLDYAGLDCGVMPDGRLVVFETNANMLVHLDAPAERRPDKARAVARIVDAMSELIVRAANGRGTTRGG